MIWRIFLASADRVVVPGVMETGALLILFAMAELVVAQHAVEVVDYDAGATPASFGDTIFNQARAALGPPERFTGELSNFPGQVTPFNPPFEVNEIVSVGEGGRITLRLSHYVVPQSQGPELGVFTNVGLWDRDYPNGFVGAPVATFGVDVAEISVSEFGVHWVSLGSQTFDGVANGYLDASGTLVSDFQQPFLHSVAQFQGLSYRAESGNDILAALDGSGGGKWIDISSTGLEKVGFVRFQVSDDFDLATALNFELDALSIATGAVGAATVPEPEGDAGRVMLAAVVGLFWFRRGRQSRGGGRSTDS